MAWLRVDDRFSNGPKVKRAAIHLGGKLPGRRVRAVWIEIPSRPADEPSPSPDRISTARSASVRVSPNCCLTCSALGTRVHAGSVIKS